MHNIPRVVLQEKTMTLHKLTKSTTHPKKSELAIGIVQQCCQGSAITIRWQERILKVSWHTDPLPLLHAGDRVLFTYMTEGVVIIARLSEKNRTPMHTFHQELNQLKLAWGLTKITLHKSGTINIANPHSCITLTRTGNVKVNSYKYQQKSQAECQLIGSIIYLN